MTERNIWKEGYDEGYKQGCYDREQLETNIGWLRARLRVEGERDEKIIKGTARETQGHSDLPIMEKE